MPAWLSVLLEIIKISVPALIVFFTVRTLLREYLNKEYNLRALDIQKKQKDATLPLKLQAYERLSLFCERINLPNLLLRIRQPGMSANELRFALLAAIQQEYEHNITQQVYVSEKLWDILTIARDDSVSIISLAAEKVGKNGNGQELAAAIIELMQHRGGSGLDTALRAIKKEAALILS